MGFRKDGRKKFLTFRTRNKEASQTRDDWVTKHATLRRAPLAQGRLLRAARPDSLGKLGTGSSPRKDRLLRMTSPDRLVDEDDKHRKLYHNEARAAAGRRPQRSERAEWVGRRRRLRIESEFNTLVGFARTGLPLPLAQCVLGSIDKDGMATLHFDGLYGTVRSN